MGDRGNIVVRQGNTNTDDVWFYTHWSGSEIKQVVTDALARKMPWGDSSYLARIIFDKLTEGRQGEETGFGISTTIQDNEHPIIVVDCPAQTVWIIFQEQLKSGRIPDGFKPLTTPQSWLSLVGKEAA